MFNWLFGGGTDQASLAAMDAQLKQNAEAAQYVKEKEQQARADAQKLFAQGQAARGQGYAGALSMIRNAINPQMDVFREGNVGAQNALYAGLPQYENAIMGNAVDYSGLAPQAYNVNTSFLDNLPTYNAPSYELSQEQITPINLSPVVDKSFLDTTAPNSASNPQFGMAYDPRTGDYVNMYQAPLDLARVSDMMYGNEVRSGEFSNPLSGLGNAITNGAIGNTINEQAGRFGIATDVGNYGKLQNTVANQIYNNPIRGNEAAGALSNLQQGLRDLRAGGANATAGQGEIRYNPLEYRPDSQGNLTKLSPEEQRRANLVMDMVYAGGQGAGPENQMPQQTPKVGWQSGTMQNWLNRSR